MKKLAVLISDIGTGTNLEAIIQAVKKRQVKAKISLVVSDTAKSLGLLRAKKHQLKTKIISQTDDLTKLLKNDYAVDYICLAGWKKIVPRETIQAFPNRILNIHPGLVPDILDGWVKNPDGTRALWNRGKLTEKAVAAFLQKKKSYAGSSVHFLTEKFDFGPVLARCFEKIKPGDTVESLYQRLKKKEHQIYVQALVKICQQ